MNLRCCFFPIFLFCAILSVAQPYTKIAAYNTTNGLSSNTVLGILKDRNGFLWVQTFNDLHRWDGINFYKPDNIRYSPKRNTNSKIFLEFNSNSILNFTYQINDNSQFAVIPNKYPFILNKGGVNYDLEKIRQKNPKSKFEYLLKNFNKKEISNYTILVDSNSYYLISDDKYLVYINDNVVSDVFDFAWTYKIWFLVDGKLVLIDPKTESVKIWHKDKIIYNSALLGFKQFKSLPYISFHETGDRTLILMGNYLLEVSIAADNKLSFKIINKFTSTENYGNVYFEENADKLLVGSGLDGLLEFKNFKINTKKNGSNQSQNIIYSQCLNDDKVINFQDIYQANFIKKYPRFSWLFNGAICYHNNKIICGSMFDLTVLDKKYNTEKVFKLENGNIIDFLKTDSVIYFINKSLNKYYPKSNKVITLNSNDFPQYGNIIQAIYPSQKPNKIYAIIGQSLQEINMENKTSITIEKGIKGEVRNLFYDSTNEYFFVSTRFDGCYFFKQDGAKNKLPNPPNQTNFSCHYVLKDKQGDYWLPTNMGLFFMSQKDFTDYINQKIKAINYKKFGKEDGIANEEFNGGFGGCGLLKGDSIYMATEGGTVIFHSSIKYSNKINKGNLIIDYVKVDDSLKDQHQLTVKPNFKKISIRVAFPFLNNRNDFIEYRLLGINDTSWTPLDRTGVLNLNTQNEGAYKLQFRVANNTVKQIELPFTVLPYWYNTWWAKLLFGLIFFTSVYIIFMWRWNTIKNKNLELINTSRNNLFETIAHDLRSPINSYIGLADDIKYLIKKRNFDDIDKLGNAMDEKSRNLSLLVSNVLNWSRSEKGLIKVDKQNFKVADVLNDILPIYLDIAGFRAINIDVNIPADAIINGDKNVFSHIIRNLIDNAIKYSENGSVIKIDFYVDKQHNVIETINPIQQNQFEKLLYISKIFKGTEKGEPHTNGLGLGISSIYNSCLLLDAIMELKIENNSVIFKLILPP